MNKSTAPRVLLAFGALAALSFGTVSFMAARSYVTCAVELLSEAPASDSNPPESFRRQARTLWGKRDIFVARALVEKCGWETRSIFLPRPVSALVGMRARLAPPQREALAATLIHAHGGRGITRLASEEFGKPPRELSESEMAWLFVVGQRPTCSQRLEPSDAERKACSSIHEGLLARLAAAASP